MQNRKTSKNYDISGTSTLVDINQDLTNFVAEIKVFPTKDKDKTYKIAIVDQTHIDNGVIEYKDVSGENGVNVTFKDGVYKNHYIALKSENPIELTVEIDLQELPRQNPVMPSIPKESEVPVYNEVLQQEVEVSNKWFSNLWFKIAIGCICLIAAIIIWKFFLNKGKSVSTSPTVSNMSPSVPRLNTSPKFSKKSEYSRSPGSKKFSMKNEYVNSSPPPSVPSTPEPKLKVSSPPGSPMGGDSLSQKVFSKYRKNYAF